MFMILHWRELPTGFGCNGGATTRVNTPMSIRPETAFHWLKMFLTQWFVAQQERTQCVETSHDHLAAGESPPETDQLRLWSLSSFSYQSSLSG